MRRLFAAYRDAYSGIPRESWVLAAVCFVNRCGTMVLPFLALYLTSQRGLTAAGAGMVLSLYGVGSGAGAYWGGRLTDRFGARRVQLASLTLTGIGFPLFGQLREPLAIGLGACVLAAVNEAFRPANAAAFAGHTPRERWTQVFAVRRLALNLGMTSGPVLGGLLAHHDYALIFLVDGATCLLAAALLALLDRSAPVRVLAATPLVSVSPWRDRPFVALLALTTGFAAVLYQFFATYPLALRELHGLGELQIGSIYAINTVLIVICEMLLVRRLASGVPLRIAAWGSLFFCGGFALLPLGRGYAFIAATVVVWTLGEMLTMPFLETVAAGRGDERSRGSYLGAHNFAFSIAFASAPVLGTSLYQRYGPVPLFAACGAMGLVLWLGLRTLAPRLAGQAPARPQRTATPAATLAPPAA